MINPFSKKIKNKILVHLILTLCTFLIYASHYPALFLNPNGVLSSIIDDSLKNYFTFVYHTTHDKNILHFSGFNYPFGEHVVFTDCQPLLSVFLHYLPFTYPYLIGILHFLVFFSFIISPSLLYSIFKKLSFPSLYAIPVSIAITLLSPQFYRIYAGHYALAYTCLIPLFYLILLRSWEQNKKTSFLLLILFNFLIFFVHPYYGLGFSLFSLISFLIYDILNQKFGFKTLVYSFFAGLLPILLFQLFMLFTDHHTGRSPEPFGNTEFISNRASFFVPFFGPFKTFLEGVVRSDPAHFEGYCYLGFATLFLTLLFILLTPFILKYLKVSKALFVLLLTSVFFLLFSMGIHLVLLDLFHLKFSAINQFRAMGRFSWFLYFILPVFLFSVSYSTLKSVLSLKQLRLIFVPTSFLFLSLHVLESHYYLTMDPTCWTNRNFFNSLLLNAEEKSNILDIRAKKAQAILPLPTYFLGSEVVDRNACTFPLIVSTLYSYHCGIPILSLYASRSSLPETETGINLLNSYLKDNPLKSVFKDKPVFAFVTSEILMNDEERMASKLKVTSRNDSVKFGFFEPSEIFQPVLDTKICEIQDSGYFQDYNEGVIFSPRWNKGSTHPLNFSNFEVLLEIDSLKIPSGEYVLSLHFYPSGKTYRYMSAALVTILKNSKEEKWQDVLPFKLLSAHYNKFGILERQVHLETSNKYTFIIHGNENIKYGATCFLLRRKGTSVRVVYKSDTLINNFPIRSGFSE